MESTQPAATPSDLDRLFRESAADLERYFFRRHGNSDEARDLVQEVFLQLAKTPARPRGSLRGYLFGIARHVSAGRWRKHFRRPRFEPLSESNPEAIDTKTPQDDRLDQAREILARLPAQDREVLEFRLGLGLSYAETAEALGIPIGTVRSRLNHAITELRERLARENHPT